MGGEAVTGSPNVSVPADSDPTSQKRLLEDTSFVESEIDPKRHTSSPIRLESFLLGKIEESFNRLSQQIANASSKADDQHKELKDELTAAREASTALITRVQELEAENVALTARVSALEADRVADPQVSVWAPSDPVETSVLLFGDSNTKNIRFGNDRGTLGAALPGKSRPCMKINDIPAACDDVKNPVILY